MRINFKHHLEKFNFKHQLEFKATAETNQESRSSLSWAVFLAIVITISICAVVTIKINYQWSNQPQLQSVENVEKREKLKE